MTIVPGLMLLVGLSLEMSHSWWRVASVYSLGVTAGSLVTAVFNPGTFLAGASGGVYALASAHIAAILLNWKEDSLILRQRLRLEEKQCIHVIMTVMAL